MKFNLFKKDDQKDILNILSKENKDRYDFEGRKKSDYIIIGLIILIAIITIVVVALLIRNSIISKKDHDKSKEILSSFEHQLPRNNERNQIIDTPDVKPDIKIDEPPISKKSQKGSRIMYGDFEIVGSIRIPKTGINYPILTPTTEETLKISTPLFETQNGINEPGNTTIFGHNFRNGKFFSNNYKLKIGDSIYIKDNSGREIKYVIYNKVYTSPSDAAYIRRNTGGAREISLSTCSDNVQQRLIIFAKEAQKEQ